MKPKETPENYTAWAGFSIAAAWAAALLPFGAAFGWVAGAAYLAGGSLLAGSLVVSGRSVFWRLAVGTPVFLAAWAAVGGVAYQLFGLSLPVILAVAAALPAASLWALRRSLPPPEREIDVDDRRKGAVVRTLTTILFLTVALSAWRGFAVLSASATDLAIRSPWVTVPPSFLWLVFFCAAAALSLAAIDRNGRTAAAALSVLALLTVSVAVLAYRVGYGFDPFIHQATERVIAAAGSISPKPLYYSGQYALVTGLVRVGQVGLLTADRWLLPALFALLPPFAAFCLRRSFRLDWPLAAVASGGVLLLPLSSFISTTPQGLANLMVLFAAFAALPSLLRPESFGRVGRFLPLPFAAAAAATHPLAGLPALVFAAAWLAFGEPAGPSVRRPPWRQTAIGAAFAVGGALALPAAFLLNAKLSGASVAWSGGLAESASAVAAQLTASISAAGRRYHLFLDSAYLWQHLRPIALWGIGLLGLLAVRRRKAAAAAPYAVAVLAAGGSWAILKGALRFDFLIEYEQSGYADRLPEVALFLLAPAACLSLTWLAGHVRRGPYLLQATAAALLAAGIAMNAYLAYPRLDLYQSSRGWSTGAADILTVRQIEEDAAGEPYVVLANQSVSAAAIQEIGFGRYFRPEKAPGTEMYFYPIPTGDPLYALFLQANESFGDRETIRQAMDLSGADLAYLVVSEYWWQANRIVAGAKKSADGYWSADGRNFIFRYRR